MKLKGSASIFMKKYILNLYIKIFYDLILHKKKI